MLWNNFSLGPVELRNRAVLPPMCTYLAENDGLPTAFHKQHYLSRAIGGVGLLIQEATAIDPNGRITARDLGLWNEQQQEALGSLVRDIHDHTGAKVFVQLGHAGRKSEVAGRNSWSASPLVYADGFEAPAEMTLENIQQFRLQMKEAAHRACLAGYDGVEIHAAHGYLISSFLSPLSNHRKDQYGGSLENRRLLLAQVLEDIRQSYPKDKALGIRISAEDYVSGGMHKEEMAEILSPLVPLLDFVHVSSGAVVSDARIASFPLYQLEFARYLKQNLSVPVIAVGRITTTKEAEFVLQSGAADLVAFGRLLLRDPFYLMRENPDLAKPYEPYFRGLTE